MERFIKLCFVVHWMAIGVNRGIAVPPRDSAGQIADMETHVPELKDSRFLLFFGRIHPKKGCDLLLRAFSKVAQEFPDTKLVIAGPGDPAYVESMRGIVDVQGIGSKVLWTGMITGPVKWGLLRAADAFVLPSHQENFAIATVEAMAVDTPVLISDKVQIWREVTRSGACLVDSRRTEGTQRLLRRWLNLNDAERAKVRNAARAWSPTKLNCEQAAGSVL